MRKALPAILPMDGTGREAFLSTSPLTAPEVPSPASPYFLPKKRTIHDVSSHPNRDRILQNRKAAKKSREKKKQELESLRAQVSHQQNRLKALSHQHEREREEWSLERQALLEVISALNPSFDYSSFIGTLQGGSSSPLSPSSSALHNQSHSSPDDFSPASLFSFSSSPHSPLPSSSSSPVSSPPASSLESPALFPQQLSEPPSSSDELFDFLLSQPPSAWTVDHVPMVENHQGKSETENQMVLVSEVDQDLESLLDLAQLTSEGENLGSLENDEGESVTRPKATKTESGLDKEEMRKLQSATGKPAAHAFNLPLLLGALSILSAILLFLIPFLSLLAVTTSFPPLAVLLFLSLQGTSATEPASSLLPWRKWSYRGKVRKKPPVLFLPLEL